MAIHRTQLFSTLLAAEARLLEAIRPSARHPRLSFVAERDGGVVGHVMISLAENACQAPYDSVTESGG
jgi:predicted N-acetyltransferase YhbS